MPLKFRKVLIADERFESAAFIDVNNDGVMDIVSGGFWYEGPTFRKQHKICDVPVFGDYYDDFSTIALDVNGDDRMDFITGGWWGKALRWVENTGDYSKPWPVHVIAETGNIESTRAYDIDGDGVVEILPNCPPSPVTVFKLKVDANGKGTGEFDKYVLCDCKQGHGQGCGDVTGHGRMDIVLSNGWLEAPADPWREKWTWHPEFQLFKSASVPILVADVNGDGVNDLIVGGGHEYGLDWWEQRVTGGQRQWIRHPIDPFNSQYHDLKWVDIDGDGQPELVTGKRYRAHVLSDPGSLDDYGMYYFKWTGESFAKQIIDYGPTRIGKGCGIFFDMADLTGNGLPDILAPGKDGLYVFYNEGLG
jgi:hypothetical protein